MKKIELLRNLERYPVFTIKTIRDTIEKGSDYAKLVAYRLKKENLIFEIEKNKYTTHNDPLLVASHIVWPSYITGWSALRYYNLIEQLPHAVFVATTRPRKKKEIAFGNAKIIFMRIKPKYLFGYAKERYNDADIFIADKEKALIDAALFKKISFSEISRIVKENAHDIDMALLVKYIIKVKNKTLAKRFGFLFDSLKIGIDKKLIQLVDRRFAPLEYALPPQGKKNKKWRIIENAGL